MSLRNIQPFRRSMRDNSIEFKASNISTAHVTANNFKAKSSVRTVHLDNRGDNFSEASKDQDKAHLTKRIGSPDSKTFMPNLSQLQSKNNFESITQSTPTINLNASKLVAIPCVLELPTVRMANEPETKLKQKLPITELSQFQATLRSKLSNKLLRIPPALNSNLGNQQLPVKLHFVSLNPKIPAVAENVAPIKRPHVKEHESKPPIISTRRNLLISSTAQSRITSNFLKVRDKIDIKRYLYHIRNSPKRLEKRVSLVKPTHKPKSFMINSSAPFIVGSINHKSALKSAEYPSMLMCRGILGPFLLIFGGLSSFIHSDFAAYNFTDKTFFVKNYSKNVDLARFGHSMDQIGNTVYIYGGTNSFQGYINRNLNINFSNVSPEFFGLNLETWKIREIKSPNLCQPTLRKFHASFVFDNSCLFVLGGVKPGDKFAKDVWIFEPEDENWHEFEISNEMPDLDLTEGIAHHKVVCMSSTITTLKTDKASKEYQKGPQDTSRRNIYLFKSEKKYIVFDIYMFGGINSRNNIIDNELYQLCMKSRLFYFKKLPVRDGYRPQKRHSHSMTKINNESLMIYGGRGQNNSFLNSMDCFSFTTKSWSRLDLVNNEWDGDISSHAVTAHESVLFIFGGISQNGFLEPNIYYCGCA